MQVPVTIVKTASGAWKALNVKMGKLKERNNHFVFNVFGLISLSLPRWIFGHLHYFSIFFILSNKMSELFKLKNLTD